MVESHLTSPNEQTCNKKFTLNFNFSPDTILVSRCRYKYNLIWNFPTSFFYIDSVNVLNLNMCMGIVSNTMKWTKFRVVLNIHRYFVTVIRIGFAHYSRTTGPMKIILFEHFFRSLILTWVWSNSSWACESKQFSWVLNAFPNRSWKRPELALLILVPDFFYGKWFLALFQKWRMDWNGKCSKSICN